MSINYFLLNNKTNTNSFILSNTKNIYSFYKIVHKYFFNHYTFTETKKLFLNVLLEYFYSIVIFFKHKRFNSKKIKSFNVNFKKYNRSSSKIVKFTKKISNHLSDRYSSKTKDIFFVNKYYYLKQSINLLYKIKKILKNVNLKKKTSFLKKTRTFFILKKNNFKYSYKYKIFFIFTRKIRFKNDFFIRRKKRSFIINKINTNILKYLLYYNANVIKKQRQQFYFSKYLIFKTSNVSAYTKQNFKKNYSLRQMNLRHSLKYIHMPYFFTLFKRTIKKNLFSLLYNVFIHIKKERSKLKKKLTFFFNSSSIGIITYNNTLRNVFITLSDSSKNHIYHLSSGMLKFFGRKKVYSKTIYNLTRRFLYKIQPFLIRHNFCFIKLRLVGFLQDTFTFLNIFYRRLFFYKKELFFFKKYVIFYKKYIFYIKNIIYGRYNYLNIKKYLNILTSLFYILNYLNLKKKFIFFSRMKLLTIQVQTPKFFSK